MPSPAAARKVDAVTDIRDVGDGYPIRYEARDPDTRELVAATVALTITDPAAAVTTPTPTNPSTGIYDYTIPLASAGSWSWVWDATGAVTDKAYGSVYAQTPAPSTYATLTQLKSRLRITDTVDDDELQSTLATAARRVDDDCGRRFWQDLTASSRTYRPTHPTLLLVDDISTSPDLVVEVGRGATWTAVDLDDVDFLPENAVADLRAIEILERAAGVWPLFGSTRVRITARWGWPVVPEPIVNATLIMASRLSRRRDSPEGILGNSDFGPLRVSRYDADYDNLIHPYVKQAV